MDRLQKIQWGEIMDDLNTNESNKMINNFLNDNPLVSVMVPVYNTEKYLERCIQSILNQTYENLEIIIINDGSDDSSPQICEKFAQVDNRVVVIHKENGGLSDTRNVGLKYAKGDFYAFVDSDDWILQNMIEELVYLCKKHDSEIAQCEWFSNLNEMKIQSNVVNTLQKKEFMPLILTDEITSHIWRNLYKKELFDGISFPLGYVAQDMMVFHEIANKAKTMVKTDKKLYYYFATRTDNTSNNPKGLFKGTMCRALAFKDRYNFSLNEYSEVKNILLKKAVRYSLASFCRVSKSDYLIYQKEMENLHGFLVDNSKEVSKNSSISFFEIISVKLIKINRKIFILGARLLRIN